MPKIKRSLLTDDDISAAKDSARNTGKTVRLWDSVTVGLGCKVYPSGNVAWVLRYPKSEGATAYREVTLRASGSLDLARVSAMQTQLAIKGGTDPLEARKKDREAPKVWDAIHEWTTHLMDEGLKPSTIKEYNRLFNRECFGSKKQPPTMHALARLRVKDVTAADVRVVFKAITQRNAPKTANRVMSRLKAFFQWCEAEEQGYREANTNPVRVKLNREEAHERYLTDEETKRLLEALDRAESVGLPVPPRLKQHMKKRPAGPRGRYKVKDRDITPANARAVGAIRLLLATGWRESEVLSLKWEYVDLKSGAVVLPETKTGKSKRTLSRDAIAIIKKQERIVGNPYVFPNADNGSHLKETKRVWYAVRYAAGLDAEGVAPVRIHDLRHNFASVLASEGASLLQVGAALGHKSLAATQRYTHLFADELKAIQDRASARILGTTGANPASAAKKRPALKRQAGKLG